MAVLRPVSGFVAYCPGDNCKEATNKNARKEPAIMKRLAMFAATGLIALVPSIASARPHFFFAFPLPFPFFAPPPVVIAPPVVVAAQPCDPAPVVVSAPACDPAPVYVSAPVCDPAPVYVAPPTVIYAPAPVYRYYDYHYYCGPRYGYHYGYGGGYHWRR
jgi:hypothetical protein